MPGKKKGGWEEGWESVRVRRGLCVKADEFVKTKRAQDLGLANRTALVEYFIREGLKREGVL